MLKNLFFDKLAEVKEAVKTSKPHSSAYIDTVEGGLCSKSKCNIKRVLLSYFLTDEKVCKESPRTSRMVLGLPRRPKGSDGSAACGGGSDLSEWQRSADDDAAPSARKLPGTATGGSGSGYLINNLSSASPSGIPLLNCLYLHFDDWRLY